VSANGHPTEKILEFLIFTFGRSPWWRNCRMQKNMGTTNSSRTSDRMFSGDAYTDSKKQQF
jgi:hypothetical protein